MDDNYIIYMHMNKSNGKIYFGQTRQEPNRRWEHGNGYKESQYFYNAIKKYGWDGFWHVVLKEHLTLDEANMYEKELIKNFETQNHDKGYNLGFGGDNHRMTEESKKKLSESHKGNKNHKSKFVYCVELNKKYSCIRDAERDLGIDHSNICKVCCGKKKTAGGYHWRYVNS